MTCWEGGAAGCTELIHIRLLQRTPVQLYVGEKHTDRLVGMLLRIEGRGPAVAHARGKKYSSQATRLIALSFGGVILVGTLLLMLPISSKSGVSCGLVPALFTATSATCVTGLVVADTLSAWTLFGQVVILAMIQLGGLGFMTMLFYLGTVMRRRASLNQRLMMVSSFNLNDMAQVDVLVRHALKTTCFIEGIGAVILIACFLPRYGLSAIWKGIFIAVSAFCNAGFDILGPDGGGSLMSYNQNPVVLLTVAALVVCGGLGFFVWEELIQKRCYRTLSLYSKMVLWLTGGFLLLGTVFFLGMELPNDATLGALPLGHALVNALFQSATLRTAGFYSIAQNGLADVSLVMCILLMLVGGSSGSTAGGIKTVTVGVLFLALRSSLRGEEQVILRGRTIPSSKVLAALTLVLAVGSGFIASSMAIAIVDQVPYLWAAYEAASAMGTVGLTVGITPELSTFSHLVLIAMMYLGRVGILSFSIAFLGRGKEVRKISYPNTNVMIG